jgi:hypothetical protein
LPPAFAELHLAGYGTACLATTLSGAPQAETPASPFSDKNPSGNAVALPINIRMFLHELF